MTKSGVLSGPTDISQLKFINNMQYPSILISVLLMNLQIFLHFIQTCKFQKVLAANFKYIAENCFQ